jgi:DNA polymerase I
MHIQGTVNHRSLQNWPMQSTAADVLRVATIAAVESGIEVCALIHDAFLIEAPTRHIRDAVRAMRHRMVRAGRVVIGDNLRVDDPQIVWPGRRFYDSKGEPMYRKVTALLPEVAA